MDPAQSSFLGVRMPWLLLVVPALVEKQPRNQRIGVVTFAESAAVVQAPTIDHESVLAAISRLRTYRGTAIGRGILVSLDTILEEYGKPPISRQADSGFGGFNSQRDQGYGSRDQGVDPQRDPGMSSRGRDPSLDEIPPAQAGETYPSAIIVLLSDGQSNTGPDPLEVVDKIADRGVKIYTVGLGSPEGTVLRIFNRSMRVRLDKETLKRIAEKTGGAYLKAETDTDLRGIYENLGKRLVFEAKRTEITAVFAALAALLLMVTGALSLAWFDSRDHRSPAGPQNPPPPRQNRSRSSQPSALRSSARGPGSRPRLLS